MSQIKVSIQNDDRYMDSCREQYIARLELAKEAINGIQDSLSTQVPYIANEFSALGLTSSKARDALGFIKDSIRIVESKKDPALQGRLDNLKAFLKELLKNFRKEQENLANIASSFDIEIDKQISIGENKAAIFKEIALRQTELKNKGSTASLNLKRTIPRRTTSSSKKRQTSQQTLLPSHFPLALMM